MEPSPPPHVGSATLERVGQRVELTVSTIEGLAMGAAVVELRLHRAGIPDRTWVRTLTPDRAASMTVPIVVPALGAHAQRGLPTLLIATTTIEIDGRPHVLHSETLVVAGQLPEQVDRVIGGVRVLDRSAHFVRGLVPSVDGDVEVYDASE